MKFGSLPSWIMYDFSQVLSCFAIVAKGLSVKNMYLYMSTRHKNFVKIRHSEATGIATARRMMYIKRSGIESEKTYKSTKYPKEARMKK